MKRIIISLSVIAVAAAVVVGATTAYFSDTETSEGNTFTAGTIDIAVDGENPWVSNYQIADLKPGEVDYINFEIKNVGQNPVNISKRLQNWVYDGGLDTFCEVSSEPEFVAEGGAFDADGNCVYTDWVAKDNLKNQIVYDLSVEVYEDENATDPIWWQTIYTGEEGYTLSDVYSGGNYVDLGMLPVGGVMKVVQSYHFKETAGNKFQGDVLTFDIVIQGDQLTQENGYASVELENKNGAPLWDIIGDDDVKGTLSYKTHGTTFDYNFTAQVNTSGDYTLIYVGPTGDYPCTGSKVIGSGTFSDSSETTISGSADTGTIEGGKVWLVPSSTYNETTHQMTGWDHANNLYETGLIDYVQN